MRKTILSLILLAAASPALADDSIIVQSTTSTANSGLYEHLAPIFTGKTGVRLNVVAVGTGQAIKNAKNCDGDVLLVHAKPSEEKFVAEGYGVARADLMYNDFILVGPESDPAEIVGGDDAEAALRHIAETGAAFASRGTIPARIRKSARSGPPPRSTRTPPRATGTARPARAWARR